MDATDAGGRCGELATKIRPVEVGDPDVVRGAAVAEEVLRVAAPAQRGLEDEVSPIVNVRAPSATSLYLDV